MCVDTLGRIPKLFLRIPQTVAPGPPPRSRLHVLEVQPALGRTDPRQEGVQTLEVILGTFGQGFQDPRCLEHGRPWSPGEDVPLSLWTLHPMRWNTPKS